MEVGYATGTYSTVEDLLPFLQGYSPNCVVIERFVGAGPRSADSTYTIDQIGFLRGVCYILNYTVELHMPQKRLPFLENAKQLCDRQRHGADALAHLLAYEYWKDR